MKQISIEIMMKNSLMVWIKWKETSTICASKLPNRYQKRTLYLKLWRTLNLLKTTLLFVDSSKTSDTSSYL